MKKCILMTVLIANAICAEDNIVITKFCEQFHQRSYVILRLSKIIAAIRKYPQKPYTFNFNYKQFSDDIILSCIAQIEKNQSLQPFYALWNEVKRYKYIDDPTFSHDFTKLLFTIQHTMYTHTTQTKHIPSCDIELSLKGTSYTEATTIRNYYFKRLQDVFMSLKKIHCSKQSLFDIAAEDGCDCSFITNHTFVNKEIKKCIQKMEEQQAITPLIQLSKDFYSCKLIKDDIFMREFIAITFIVLRNIFMNNIPASLTPTQKKYTSHVAYIYQNIDKLPLEEILEAIDLLHKELPPLLEKYQFNSSMKWGAWFKKYWWLPPTLCTIFGIRILWIFNNDTPPPNNPLFDQEA